MAKKIDLTKEKNDGVLYFTGEFLSRLMREKKLTFKHTIGMTRHQFNKIVSGKAWLGGNTIIGLTYIKGE